MLRAANQNYNNCRWQLHHNSCTLAWPLPGIPSGHNPPVIPKANSEPVGDDAHIVPQMCRDILVRVDEGIDPYERALRSSLYTARSADWCGLFQGFPPATIRFLLMQVELRAEDEGFDCRSAGRRNVRWQPVFELAAPSAHRALGFRWVRIPHDWIKNQDTRKGILIFWQRMRDSNPRKRSQSPVCYRYTNPLYVTRGHMVETTGLEPVTSCV